MCSKPRRAFSSPFVFFFPLLLALGASAESRDDSDDDGDGFSVARVGALLLSNGIAFDDASGRAFVTSGFGGITVVDTECASYLETFDVSRDVVYPSGIAFAAGKLYVESLREIAVIDAATGRVLRKIARPFSAGSLQAELVASPDGTRVYSMSGSSPDLVTIDVATDSIAYLVPIGPDHTRIALSPDGAIAYVTNTERATITAVDLARGAVGATAAIASEGHGVLDFPCAVGVSRSSGRVYALSVAADYRASVTEFDAGLAPLAIHAAGRFATGLDVSPDGRFLLLGSGQVLDIETGFFAADLPLPQNGVSEVAFRGDVPRAIVTHDSERSLLVVGGFRPALRAAGVAAIGGRVDLEIDLPGAAFAPFQLAASNTTMTGIPTGSGILFPLDQDPLFQLSLSGEGQFAAFGGVLDENGRARTALTLSRDLPIRGAGYPVSLALATFETRREKGDVRRVSNTVAFVIER